jgi:calcineurin-like phosphoesterase family protein
MIFFTADLHMGHENIIEYTNRPFTGLGKMEQTIIARYRKVVTAEDTVYFLGDLSIKGSQHRAHLDWILEQLPGTKILILGNHDKFSPFTYVDAGFQSVHTSLDIGEFVLVHDPVKCLVAKNRRWLCGHIHTLFKMNRKGNVLNVGVDQWEFYPVSLEEVRREFDETSLES